MVGQARLVCSDGDCAVLYEASGPLGELETLGCDCGAGLLLLGWPEAVRQATDRHGGVDGTTDHTSLALQPAPL